MGSSTSTKGQVWSLDLAVGLVIFVTAIFIFYKFSVNASTLDQQNTQNLLIHGKIIASYLLGAGLPTDWTASNVSLIGLTDGAVRLDAQKIDEFDQIANTNYQQSKRLLATTRDYYVSFNDRNETPVSIGGVSGIGADLGADNPDNVIRIVRFATYNASLVQVVVHIW